jgi:hypothetical protein
MLRNPSLHTAAKPRIITGIPADRSPFIFPSELLSLLPV